MIEVELTCQGGSTVWAEVRYAFIRDKAGKPIGLIGITRDIDDRKRRERLFTKANNDIVAPTETMADWGWEYRNFVYTFASPKVKSLLGYDPEEILGKTPFDLMPPDEAKRMTVVLDSFAERRACFAALEVTNVHRDDMM